MSKSITVEKKIGCGKLNLTITHKGNALKPDTITGLKATAGRNGSCIRVQMEAWAEVISIAIQDSSKGEDTLRKIIKIMKGTMCGQAIDWQKDTTKHALSCADGIARVLEGQGLGEPPEGEKK